jgi:hypothetical protein
MKLVILATMALGLSTVLTPASAQKVGPTGKTAAQCRAEGNKTCIAVGECMGYTDAQNKKFCSK